MNNDTNGIYDRLSITKDIKDREQLIYDYQVTGRLDRDKAISIIRELRVKDKDVAQVTTVKLATGSVPFQQASDEELVSELQMQIVVLSAKLL